MLGIRVWCLSWCTSAAQLRTVIVRWFLSITGLGFCWVMLLVEGVIRASDLRSSALMF